MVDATATAVPAGRVRACVGLGANLGDARATLSQACEALAALPMTRWMARSDWFDSDPVEASGPPYLNAVALIDTGLSPEALLDALQAIEQRHGRVRPYPNAPRTLDLDLLFHGDACCHTARLTLPHPRWLARAFVLVPLLSLVAAQDLLSQPALAASLDLAGVRDVAGLHARAQTLAAAQGLRALAACASPAP